jgi:hypothetical protein
MIITEPSFAELVLCDNILERLPLLIFMKIEQRFSG